MEGAAQGSRAEQARLEFGRYLVAERERRGLSRDELVRATKLPALLVGAIEDGDPAKWPERVFVVNALRSYAGAVGLPPEELLARFDRLPEAPRADVFDPRALEAARRARAVATLLVALALLAACALGVALHGAHRFTQRAAWSPR